MGVFGREKDAKASSIKIKDTRKLRHLLHVISTLYLLYIFSSDVKVKGFKAAMSFIFLLHSMTEQRNITLCPHSPEIIFFFEIHSKQLKKKSQIFKEF